MDDSTVLSLLSFQQTGDHRFFNDFWLASKGFVTQTASNRMRRGRQGKLADGPDADVEDVVAEVFRKISEVPGKGGRGGFDPAKAVAPGVEGLRAWLSTVTRSSCSDFMKKFYGRNGRKPASFTGVGLDAMPCEANTIDFLGKAVEKIDPDAFERDEIVNSCVAGLDEAGQRLYELTHKEDLSQRAIAPLVSWSATKVCRKQGAMHEALKALLAERGIDEEWYRRPK